MHCNKILFLTFICPPFQAGTFNQGTVTGSLEGGANGCILNDPDMVLEPENNGLQEPVDDLIAIRDFWNNHPETCLACSSADIVQFAAFFAVIRQSGTPGLTPGKRDVLLGNAPAPGGVNFEWGRTDEANCDPMTTLNLPGFSPNSGSSFISRCLGSGIEIREKMMDRNGFTASKFGCLYSCWAMFHIPITGVSQFDLSFP